MFQARGSSAVLLRYRPIGVRDVVPDLLRESTVRDA